MSNIPDRPSREPEPQVPLTLAVASIFGSGEAPGRRPGVAESFARHGGWIDNPTLWFLAGLRAAAGRK
jgi:hypothetical protein